MRSTGATDNETDIFDDVDNPRSAPDEHFLRTIREFRDQEDPTKRRRDAQALYVLMATLGKTLVDMTSFGLVEEVKLNPDECYPFIPIYAAMLRSIVKECMKSEAQFGYRADEGDADQSEVARIGTSIAEHVIARNFSRHFEVNDTYNQIAFGATLWEMGWNELAGKMTSEIRDAKYRCPECKYEEPAGEDTKQRGCPECAHLMDYKPGKKIGPEKAGDFFCRIIPGFCANCEGWDVHLKGGDEDSYHVELTPSLWIGVDEVLDKARFRQVLPKAKVREAQLVGDDLLHIRRLRCWQRAQAGAEGSVYTVSRASSEVLSRRETVLQRDFFTPEVYDEHEVPKDQSWTYRTPDGEEHEVKAGTSLTSVFPDGVCVYHTGETIHAYEGANPKKRFLFVKHSPKVADKWGISPAALGLECQYAIEELVAQVQTAAHESAMPTIAYDEATVPKLVGSAPSLRIPVRRRDLDKPLRDLIHVFEGANIPPYVMNLVIWFTQQMQGILGAQSMAGGGLPDTIGKTATAFSISTAQYQSQQGVYLALRADAKAIVISRAVECYREYATTERLMRLGGPYGGGAFRFKADMLPDDLEVYVIENSYWPRELPQKQQNLMGYYQTLTLAYQAAMLRGQELTTAEEGSIGEAFQQDASVNLARTVAEIAYSQIRRAGKFFERADHKRLSAAEKEAFIQIGLELEQQAQQEAAAQAQLQTPVDPATMAPPETEPPDVQVPAEDVYLEVCNRVVVPMDEVSGNDRYMAGAFEQWGLTWDGRSAPRTLKRWVMERSKAHREGSQSQRQAMGPPPPGGQGAPGGPGQGGDDMLLGELSRVGGLLPAMGETGGQQLPDGVTPQVAPMPGAY